MTSLSTYLNFLIAMVFILAIGSNILSISYEIWAFYIKQRGVFLKRSIQDVLNDPLLKGINLTELFYSHPQIDFTKKTYRHTPAYISSTNFAQALIDVLCRKYEKKYTKVVHLESGEAKIVPPPDLPADQLERLKLAVADLPYSDIKIMLNGFINNSEAKLGSVLATMETWFSEYMNRVNGWYRVMVQKNLLIIALACTIGFNFDFFEISKTLMSDPALSAQIANEADQQQQIKIDTITNEQQQKEAVQKRQLLVAKLYEHHMPIGWHNMPKERDKRDFHFWLWKCLGWLICAGALSFGAPFWFDLLSKLVNLRKAGLKPTN